MVRAIDNFANRVNVCLRRRGLIQSIYWKDNDSKTLWNLNLKLCAKFVHKRKFMYNKYFVVCCNIVTFIKIFIGGIFCITQYINISHGHIPS